MTLNTLLNVKSRAECGREVKKRVKLGWSGWRRLLGSVMEGERRHYAAKAVSCSHCHPHLNYNSLQS